MMTDEWENYIRRTYINNPVYRRRTPMRRMTIKPETSNEIQTDDGKNLYHILKKMIEGQGYSCLTGRLTFASKDILEYVKGVIDTMATVLPNTLSHNEAKAIYELLLKNERVAFVFEETTYYSGNPGSPTRQ